jgi:hypothetical protein
MQPPCNAPDSSCPQGLQGRRAVRFGAGASTRRILVMLGWLLVPALLLAGAKLHNLLHFLTAVVLVAALWPVSTRSGEILWEGPRVSVRRYLRFVHLDEGKVQAAVVTPPLFGRQSLVLKLNTPLYLSRYVYCRLQPGTICDAWALVHERDWEPRGTEATQKS